MTQWKECTAERYGEMLAVLPPATMRGDGFLVGEPNSYRRCAVTDVIRCDYAAFVRYGSRYFEGPNMTLPELRALNVNDVVNNATPLGVLTMSDSDYCHKAIAAGWHLDARINKWRHPNSKAVYANTPRWGRYACEDHNL